MSQRIRTVKPELFRHSDLYDLEEETGLPIRVAFIALFTCCDREGRFKWRPRELKVLCLPYDSLDFAHVLDALASAGFVVRYEANGEVFGCVRSFDKHQAVNMREAQSKLPAPPDDLRETHVHAREEHVRVPNGVNVPKGLSETVMARDGYACVRCGSKDDLTIDHIFPKCIGGTHAINNLRTLCRPCNSARPVSGQGLIDDLAKEGLSLDDMSRTCMHVHAHVERKGTGREGKGREQVSPSRVDDASVTIEIWPTFDDWWSLYDKKTGRAPCEAKWRKLGQQEREAIMQHTAAYVQATPDLTYRKNPLTYLNQKTWTDEHIASQPADPVADKYKRLMQWAEESDQRSAAAQADAARRIDGGRDE